MEITLLQAAVSSSAFISQKHKKQSQQLTYHHITNVRSARGLDDSCPSFLVTVSVLEVAKQEFDVFSYFDVFKKRTAQF
jgi:hypothetical protein